MKTSRSTLITLAAILMVVALALGSRVALWSNGDHGPGGQSIGGPFTLVNGQGETVTDKDFLGRWMLIYFGYTFCPDICPTSLSVLTESLSKLNAEQRQKIVPVFVTVDPTRDTVAVMKEYAAAFGPDMVGLTGSQEQVTSAMKAYKVYAVRAKGDDPVNYTVDHSSILYLVGPDGRFVAHFAHGTNANDIAASLQKYLK